MRPCLPFPVVISRERAAATPPKLCIMYAAIHGPLWHRPPLALSRDLCSDLRLRIMLFRIACTLHCIAKYRSGHTTASIRPSPSAPLQQLAGGDGGGQIVDANCVFGSRVYRRLGYALCRFYSPTSESEGVQANTSKFKRIQVSRGESIQVSPIESK